MSAIEAARRGTSRVALAIVWVLLAIVYVWPFPYQRALNNPNENVRVFTTMALVEQRSFAIDKYFARFGSTMDVGATVDPTTGETRTYSVKAPGTSYLGVPVYAVMRAGAKLVGAYPADDAPQAKHDEWLRRVTWGLRLVTVQLPALAFLVLFERFLRRFSRDPVVRVGAVVALGLGTNFLAYALMFVSHTQFAIAAFGAWALLFVERARGAESQPVRPARLFAAGLLTGACTSFEYQGVIFTAFLSLFAATLVLTSVRAVVARGLPFAAGVLVNVAGIMWFQWKAFGSPWTPGHRLSVNAASREGHAKGLYGIQKPKLEALIALIGDPGYGLFATAPFLALGVVGLLVGLAARVDERGPRQRGAFVIAYAACLAFSVVISGMEGWRGGWTIGPRYLSVVPPFLVLGAVILLEQVARSGALARALSRAAAVGLAAGGVVALGVISVLYNSLPEEITRPFSQVAVMMIRGGIAPYSLAAWLGVYTPRAFALVFVAMAGVFVWLLLPRRGERGFGLRVASSIAVGAIAIAPAFLDGNDAAAQAFKRSLGGGRFEPTGFDEVTLKVHEIEARRKAGGDATPQEAGRLCALLLDQAQEGAAQPWCDRAKAAGLDVAKH